MAKLKGPLFSLGATAQLGKTLVYFNWKGLNVVREYVIPANPKTDLQLARRKMLRECVAAVHAAQAAPIREMVRADMIAYQALANLRKTPSTWFNEICKRWLDARTLNKRYAVFRGVTNDPGNESILAGVDMTEDGENEITAGDFWYGTSPTSMVLKTEGNIQAGGDFAKTLPGLVNGVKYYWQFRATAHADFTLARSGIYYATPAA